MLSSHDTNARASGRRARACLHLSYEPDRTMRRAMAQLRRPPPRSKRQPGELATAEFLAGLLEQARARLPAELQAGCSTRQQWSLGKLWYEEPLLHYEVW